MKFGKTGNPENVDFTLPPDSKLTSLSGKGKKTKKARVSLGYPKWDRKQLSGFYPERVSDPLAYYASRLNAIGFNATYYRIYPPEQYQKWADKTPENFRFYPKVPQSISRYRKLVDVEDQVLDFVNGLEKLGPKLGMAFLQMDNFFGPQYFSDLETFVRSWPKTFPLALELRHKGWYHDHSVVLELYDLLKECGVTFILTDTHERRDMLHMQLPTPHAFVRFVDSEHPLDFYRLDVWISRLQHWVENGLEGIHFFIHRKEVKDAPFLLEYLTERLYLLKF